MNLAIAEELDPFLLFKEHMAWKIIFILNKLEVRYIPNQIESFYMYYIYTQIIQIVYKEFTSS